MGDPMTRHRPAPARRLAFVAFAAAIDDPAPLTLALDRSWGL
jgi:hypothetical protein